MNYEAGLSLRRQLPADMLVEQWIAPGGWPHRRFRLQAHGQPKGQMLFLGGRGDFFEKYLEAIGAWRDLGWTVSGFDWRGQGGSGQLHPGGFCHVDDFATFIGDLEAFCRDWAVEGSGPHVAIGHSMGGHILLRAALDGRVKLDGIVLLSPMLGIRAGPVRGRAMHRLASIGRIGPISGHPIWRGTRSPAPGRVTSCPERQADKLWWKLVRPELGRSGPTWGWLAAATESIAELDRDLRTRPLEIPGLLLAAADDPVVELAAIDAAAKLLSTFEYRLIRGAGHELLRERDGPRNEALALISGFLDRLAASR